MKKLLQKDVFDALSKKRRHLNQHCQIEDGRLFDAEPGVGVPVRHKGYLQGGHIISRTYHGVAFSLADIVTICQAHHRYYTDHDLEWEEYWLEHDLERWSRLRRVAIAYSQNPFPKVDLNHAMEFINAGQEYWWDQVVT